MDCLWASFIWKFLSIKLTEYLIRHGPWFLVQSLFIALLIILYSLYNNGKEIIVIYNVIFIQAIKYKVSQTCLQGHEIPHNY